jgi:hypothetical protein
MNLSLIFKDLVLVILIINLFSLYIYYKNILNFKNISNDSLQKVTNEKTAIGVDRGLIYKINLTNNNKKKSSVNLINLNRPLSNQIKYKNFKCKYEEELKFRICSNDYKFTYDRTFLSKFSFFN